MSLIVETGYSNVLMATQLVKIGRAKAEKHAFIH